MEKKFKRKVTADDFEMMDNTTNLLVKCQYLADIVARANTCITIDDIQHTMKYEATKGNVFRRTIHNGQLKLLLTEIQFLTTYLKSNVDAAHVVYAGSAPSHKLGILMTMFPNVKFILVDPNEHMIMTPIYGVNTKAKTQYESPDLVNQIMYFKTAAGNRFDIRNRPIKTPHGISQRSNESIGEISPDIGEYIAKHPHKVYIIEDYMTNAIAEYLSTLPNLYFISDIRSVTDGMPTDADIIWNSAMQYNWIKRLNPLAWMLKFHPPYGKDTKILPHMADDIKECAIDLTLDGTKWKYLAGKVYIQAFAPYTSSETRLVGSGLNTAEYDIREYEDKFFYYNNMHRPLGKHNSHIEYIDYDVGIDYCGDCALMCHIISEYTLKYGESKSRDTIIDRIKVILKTIDRTLRTKASLHATCSVQYKYVVTPLQIIKHAYQDNLVHTTDD